MIWALDLDGVVWLGDRPIAGSADAIGRLRAAGHTVMFVTNNSFGRRSDVADKLGRHGIDAGEHVLTSAMAAARLVEPGSRALVCAGPGVVEELSARDVEIIDASAGAGVSVDVVVVGYHPTFDYERMTNAFRAVRSGARLLATNDDSTYPTSDGPVPGGGAILASIVRAAAIEPEIAGKPHRPMAELVHARAQGDGIMVGDRADTDGRFAVTLGYRFGLVLSGVTHADDLPTDPAPDLVAADLSTLVDSTQSGIDGAR